MTEPDSIDQLVRRYLDAVARALGDLPAERRAELLDDLGRHIAAERAELGEATEADIRAIIERLGDPADIAAEARVPESARAPESAHVPEGARWPESARWPEAASVASGGAPPQAAARRPETPTPTPTSTVAPAARRELRPLTWITVVIGTALVSCLVLVLVGLVAFFYRSDAQSPAPIKPPTHVPSPTTSR